MNRQWVASGKDCTGKHWHKSQDYGTGEDPETRPRLTVNVKGSVSHFCNHDDRRRNLAPVEGGSGISVQAQVTGTISKKKTDLNFL